MRFILLAIFLELTCCTKSQNLITNGGFDTRTKCPSRISQLKLATGWLCSGSPDLFCTCTQTRSPVYAGLSFVGSLLPHSGDCYVGFIVNSRYKEYVTFELPEKMRRRFTYCLRFLVARSVYSGLKAESLGILLHRDIYRNAVNGQPMSKSTKAVRVEDSPGAWSSVCFTFACRGGERFITIGSFGNDLERVDHVPSKKNPKNVRIFNYSRSAYYFIESVELIKLHEGETCFPQDVPEDNPSVPALMLEREVEPKDTVNTQGPFVLQQLNFQTNKSEILSSSFDELDELADYLIGQPEMNLLIMGHTDNRGSEKRNMELSEARASAVAKYLEAKGVESLRLTAIGFGNTRPVADNNNEAGRARNRRVEFQLR